MGILSQNTADVFRFCNLRNFHIQTVKVVDARVNNNITVTGAKLLFLYSVANFSF